MFNLNSLLRENIKQLVPYSSARDDFKGSAEIFLDANENSFGSPVSALPARRSAVLASAGGDTPVASTNKNAEATRSDNAGYNRYPDPHQSAVKEKLSKIKGVPPQNIFLGNGSDEVIDLLYRSFCNPGKDNVILVPPTYGMYEVSANINDVEVRKVPLTEEFQLDVEAMSEAVDDNTKLIFICSPNNPTGNSMDHGDIEVILNNFNGIVVVDEAYINYSMQRSFIRELIEYPNLVVMQTLSKAWGMAGVRIGMAFASEEIIEVLNRVKPPYNIGSPAQQLAIEALDKIELINKWIRHTVDERNKLITLLVGVSCVVRTYPTDANFILVRVTDATAVYNYLVSIGIIVRDRSRVTLCDECLRITVGTPQENAELMNALKHFKS